ncbi:MAG: iron chelate uptake ABC transporter family permease subunit [Christensenellales bacterium]
MGGTLSVSGFLLQTFFRNPIAGPYVLGVSLAQSWLSVR